MAAPIKRVVTVTMEYPGHVAVDCFSTFEKAFAFVVRQASKDVPSDKPLTHVSNARHAYRQQGIKVDIASRVIDLDEADR